MEEHDEIVRAATGSLVQVKLWQQILKEAHIPSKVVGDDLSQSFGTALPGSVELWVRKEDEEKALAALRLAEKERERAAE
ncbi:MAG TPA: DUF2007 domain-containing protein [Gemmataceae bacterium]